MTGRKVPAHRPAALQAFDVERAWVLAEYRKRERQAPGSGGRWIATRTELLQRARLEEAADGVSPKFSTLGESKGEGQSDPSNAHRGMRPCASTKSPGLISRLVGGTS